LVHKLKLRGIQLEEGDAGSPLHAGQWRCNESATFRDLDGTFSIVLDDAAQVLLAKEVVDGEHFMFGTKTVAFAFYNNRVAAMQAKNCALRRAAARSPEGEQ